MLSITDFDTKVPEISAIEKSQFIVPKTLFLNRKNKYAKLHKLQSNRTITIRKPNSHKYEFDFEISLDDTGLTEMFLYQKNFTTIPKDIVLLWVCSVKRIKSSTSHKITVSEIDWHFSIVETKEELTSKHKGIISRLKKQDLLIAAGEIYKTDSEIRWNNITGALKRNMQFNEQIIGGSYANLVLTPIMQKCTEQNIIFDKDILKKYAPDITYDYCNMLMKNEILVCSKEKVCNC